MDNTKMIRVGIVILAVATAIIHLVLGVLNGLPMFILNGIGYMALAGILYLPQLARFRTIIRLGLLAFTAVTIFGWVLVGENSLIAYVDKAIELALVILLLIDSRFK
jgi:hypothetical protein